MSGFYNYQAPPGYKLVPDPSYGDYNRYSRLAEQVRGSMNGQQQPVPMIPARFVTSSEEIRPNETPDDGTVALFLRSDYKAIHATQKNKNGLIDFVTYVPERPIEQQNAQNAVVQQVDLTPISERLTAIEGVLQKLNAMWSTPASGSAETSAN